MTRIQKRVALGLALLAFISPGLAMAYVDAGTGAYIVQSIMALFGVITFYATRPIRLLHNLFSRKHSSSTEPSSQSSVMTDTHP